MAGLAAARCVYVPLPGAVLEICVGPPAPDLPLLEFPDIGPDLPSVDLPDVDAGPDTGANIEADVQTDTKDDVCTEGCHDCVAANTGSSEPVSYQNDQDRPVCGTAERGYAYLQFVCGLGHFPDQRLINEWQFAAYSWDGIEPGPCVMLEAKFGYYEFLEDDWGGDRPRMKDRAIRAGVNTFTRFVTQSSEQVGRLLPFQPDVGLKWVFSHQRPMIYALSLMNDARVVGVETEWRPMVRG